MHADDIYIEIIFFALEGFLILMTITFASLRTESDVPEHSHEGMSSCARTGREVPGIRPMQSHGKVPERYRAVFLQTMESDISALSQALDTQRFAAVISMLHRIHGALAAMGMQDFAERCDELGKEGRLQGLSVEMTTKVADLIGDLNDMLKRQ